MFTSFDCMSDCTTGSSTTTAESGQLLLYECNRSASAFIPTDAHCCHQPEEASPLNWYVLQQLLHRLSENKIQSYDDWGVTPIITYFVCGREIADV